MASCRPNPALSCWAKTGRSLRWLTKDISAEETVVDIAGRLGIDRDRVLAGINGGTGQTKLAAMVDQAVAEGVVGSPYFVVDGEGFFGADRLPQVEWRLKQPSYVRNQLHQALKRENQVEPQ